ncbi:MAG: SDR family oxidoreductase [Acidimicrobiales bacterium]
MPRWIERGHGHLLLTASAAGLLTNLGTAPYAVTKHACVALAEWIKITYGEQGVGVSCLCPRSAHADDGSRWRARHRGGVKGDGHDRARGGRGGRGCRPRRRTVPHPPHPEVATYEQRRAGDRERWLTGMQKLQASLPGG